MKLELQYYDIDSVEFTTNKDCYIDGRTLYINKRQLLELFSKPALMDVDILLAAPGESCRIVNVGDVVQPRAKKDAPEATFPGFLGEMCAAGDGVTAVLRNVAVMENLNEYKLPAGSIVDMSGPGADYTVFSKTNNIIVVASPGEGVSENNYVDALKKTVLSTSRFLAELSFSLNPDEIEVFELKKKPADCILPKVVHVWVSFSHARNVETLIYGHECHSLLPTIIHPNEVLDGALINRNYRQISNGETTYTLQNHPLIRELYARDGKDIDFRGVILLNCFSDSVDKKLASIITATLASFLEADYAIITKEGGGHPQLDMAMCCDALSKKGIKSTMIIVELMATGTSSKESLLFNTPTADSIVSGGRHEHLTLPAVDRIIGSKRLFGVEGDMDGSVTLSNRWIRGAMSQIGGSYVMSIVID